MFVITTDGMENASHIYPHAKVKEMIEKKKGEGWEFIFIGANIDSAETAASIGIDSNRAVNYVHDGTGTRKMYEAVSNAARSMRCSMPMADDWAADLNEDYKKRG